METRPLQTVRPPDAQHIAEGLVVEVLLLGDGDVLGLSRKDEQKEHSEEREELTSMSYNTDRDRHDFLRVGDAGGLRPVRG